MLLNKLFLQKSEEKDWTKAEILLALCTAKTKSNRANLKNKEDLMTYWKELAHCIPVMRKQYLLRLVRMRFIIL